MCLNAPLAALSLWPRRQRLALHSALLGALIASCLGQNPHLPEPKDDSKSDSGRWDTLRYVSCITRVNNMSCHACTGQTTDFLRAELSLTAILPCAAACRFIGFNALAVASICLALIGGCRSLAGARSGGNSFVFCMLAAMPSGERWHPSSVHLQTPFSCDLPLLPVKLLCVCVRALCTQALQSPRSGRSLAAGATAWPTATR